MTKNSFKTILFVLSGFLFLPAFSQTTSNSNSLRHFLGQTKTYILNDHQNCHIDQQGIVISVDCNNDKFVFKFKDGIYCNSVLIWAKDSQECSSQFNYESFLLKEEGWQAGNQENKDGTLFMEYSKGNASLRMVYWPVANWLGFDVINN